MEDLKCPICGNPTRVWYGNARKDHLCGKHADLLKEGKLMQCENCGEWHLTEEACAKCGAKDESVKIEATANTDQENHTEQNKRICLACNEESGEYLFCKSCYRKYHNKELLIKVTHCKEISVLDESYEGIYVCKDGHVVKSKSERDIDNYLFENHIAHAYEKTLWIDGDEFKPDFCLFFGEKKVYIEHWGYDEKNAEYTRQKNYKLEKYEKSKITLICTYEKTDAKNIDSVLERKLNNYEENKINYLQE